jgi:hypothetical protein
MSFRKIKKEVYLCHCELPNCGHEWETNKLPDRCAKCKGWKWNGPRKRTKKTKTNLKEYNRQKQAESRARKKALIADQPETLYDYR